MNWTRRLNVDGSLPFSLRRKATPSAGFLLHKLTKQNIPFDYNELGVLEVVERMCWMSKAITVKMLLQVFFY